MSISEVQTQLVDFDAIESADAVEQRSELVRNVTSLFALTSETCSVEQLGIYDMVLVRLADMVEAEVRQQIAERLATLRRVPAETVQKLARDDIEVARPILIGSVALSDNDLLDVATSLGIGHAGAIAERDVLSDVVTDALINLDDVDLHKKVVANRNAKISNPGFEKLVASSSRDEGLQIGLTERGDVPDRIITALIGSASETVRQKLINSGRAQDASRMQEAGAVAVNNMSNEYWLSRYDFESAWQRVCMACRKGPINEKLLRQFAMQDRFAEAAAAFAVIVDMPFEQSKHWLVRTDPTPFLVTARALGFDNTTVKAMLAMGPWRHRLSAEDRAKAFSRYQKISFGEARQMIDCWRSSQKKAA